MEVLIARTERLLEAAESSGRQTQRPGGIHRRGRPSLRVLAYRAAVGLVMHNADFRARFQTLTQRKQNKLCKKAAYMAIANKLLRALCTWRSLIRPMTAQLHPGSDDRTW